MDLEQFYAALREPDFIPGYEIQNRLGGGAFGDVYKARKVSIGKSYAIKFLRLDDEANRSVVQRELEQVRYFAAIDHPNLVSIEDVGEAGEVPYVIMGYAGEDTLARRLRSAPIEPALALSYWIQACRGVHALHERRLVHLDLKPSNVFVKGELARVGDYGLARLQSTGSRTLSFGRGTPHYMAPEILSNRADLRADVYSLGVMLFELLARELPYTPVNGLGLVLRLDDKPPPFPSAFPARLRDVVTRCLRVAPEDRFQSVLEVLEAIGQSGRPGAGVLVPARAPARVAVAAAVEPGSSAGEELRLVASELTRGAVEIARGMWEGLRSGSGTPREPEQEASPPRASRNGHPRRAAEPAGRSGDGPVPPPVGARGAALLQADGPLVMAPPPRAEGGLLGTLGAGLALGLEILGAVVSAPLGRAGRAMARLEDRVLRPGAGRPLRGPRLLGYLLAATLLAALFTWMVVQVIAP